MTSRAGQIEGPAKWVAVAVLGGAGLIGIGRSFVVDTVHAPPTSSVVQPVRVEPRSEPTTPPSPPSATQAGPDPAIDARASTLRDAPKASAPPEPLSIDDDASIRINVNAASAAELDLLPGIGPVYAERILEERTANGPFASLEDLQRVRGIGPKTAEKLRALVSFDLP